MDKTPLTGVKGYIMLLILAVVTSMLYYFIWSRKHSLRIWRRLGIPGPEPSFWFGNVQQLAYGRVNTWEVLECWKHEYGRVFGYHIGLRPTLNIVDVDIVKEICVGQFSNFVNRPDVLQNREHIGRLTDDRWKHTRKVMNPIFTTSKMKSLINMVNSMENETVEIISETIAKFQEIPAYKLSKGLTFQIIAKTAFAIDVNSQRDENDPFYYKLKTWIGQPYNVFAFLTLMFPGFGFLFRFIHKFDTRTTWNSLFEHIQNIIQYRRSHRDVAPGDLLGLMLAAGEGKLEQSRTLKTNMLDDEESDTKPDLPETIKPDLSETVKLENKKSAMTDKAMVENLVFFLMAGFDSTSNTIAFALHFLAIYDQVQVKVYEEVRYNITDPENISIEDCKKLKYLERVVFETMRLFPPVPIFVHRQCAKTVTIKGVTIPKGTVVECPPWLLHRDPEYWPDPENFDPDRFLPENQTESQKFAYIPFGAGPRMCIGAKFAMIEVITALAKIVTKFSISKGPGFKETVKLGMKHIVLNPAEEIYLTLKSREL